MSCASSRRCDNPGFGAQSAYALSALNIDLPWAVPSNAEMEIPNEL